MREQVELLEDHPGLATDLLDVADVGGQFRAVDHDAAGVVLLETVDAADHGALPRSGRTDHHDDFLPADVEVHIGERGEIAEPFVDTFESDDHLPRAP